MRRRFEVAAITLLVCVACGCAVRVGQPADRPAAHVAPAETPAPPAAVTTAADPPPIDPSAILTCDCLERR